MGVVKPSMERIQALLDEGSFMELGQKVERRSTDFPTVLQSKEGDGVVTGYGLVAGKPVFVYSQDASVYGGAMGEMHAKKIVDLYRRAMKMGVPVIGIIDSVGLRLEEVTDGLEGFGELFKVKADASGVIPEIDLIFGRAGGGMAVAAGLSDFVLMEKDNASLFLNAPNTVDGNRKEKLDTSKAAFRAKECGNVDFVGTKDEIIAFARTLVELLPCNYEEDALTDSQDDLNRLTPELEDVTDVRYISSSIADLRQVTELKAEYEPGAFTAFVKLDGVTVGVIGNAEEKLTNGGLVKMAEFLKFCDAYSLPVVSIVKADGFASSLEEEKALLKGAARFVSAAASATVPKITLLVGESAGTAYSIMNSKALGADIVYAAEGSKIRVMDPDSAAKIIGGDDLSKVAEAFDEKQTALAAAKRGYVDEIVSMTSLRKKILAALEMLFTKRDGAPKKKHASR